MPTDLAKLSRVLTTNTTSVTINSNTINFALANTSANGYIFLPNGLKMNWGTFNCNTTSTVTFTSEYRSSVLSVSVTPRSITLVGANTPFVASSNTTVAVINCAATGASGQNAYFIAIGV